MKKDELVGVRKTIAAHLLHNAVMIGPTVEDGIPAVEEAAQSQSQPIEEAAISAVEEAVDSKSQPPVDKATIPADQLASQPPVEKACKRKRKDKGKSSFFYSKQKKSSRIYCVCRKRNDGRLYWHCDSCNEWYHPVCMGFDEKEEPHVYICPSCQVKIKRKACPTLEEVEEKLRKDIEVEKSDPMGETVAGGLQDHSETTPVFLNNPHVRFFIEIKKRKGQEILIQASGWGEFVLMSENDFENYESFKNKITEDLLILDCSLEYFLSVCVKEKVEVLYYTDCIVRLVPSNVIDQYKKWLEEAKCSLHLD
ncbi:uncharacterized protein LOC128246645 [Mya arenaria]|uniref:uncharacterized protein LOC128246645 n=1 Tax=Mya arenaria TaxID=6604 RepID=UPI0022E2E5EB|nr:uncharacterized protein LOC128246645 [Mya arenaria]